MGRAAYRFYLAAFTLLGYCQSETLEGRAAEICQIDPTTIVSDACASYDTLDALNSELQPSIRALTSSTDFFSYYRLNLYDKECPFWSDENSMCGNIACAVNTIDHEEDVPPVWRTEELSKLEGPKAQHPDRKAQKERDTRPLLGELGADVGESCVVEYDDECDERDYCVPEDESATAHGDYVSLVDNPERFTGYSGPGAHQVWEAIYRENCFSREPEKKIDLKDGQSEDASRRIARGRAMHDFKNVMRESERQSILTSMSQGSDDSVELEDECLEKRVFYRIISGMHSSISTHLCYDYLNKTSGEWGPNLACFEERLRAHPERVSNLYFNYALVLRAVAKAHNTLKSYTFCSGDPSEDTATKAKVLRLSSELQKGPSIYDESLMFKDPSVQGLKEDFRSRFRNVSRAMDCVGCDKCRLWGKVQTSGYGTALKLLFEFEETQNVNNPLLRRTEVVALFNTLDKLSHALTAIKHFEDMLTTQTNPRNGSKHAGPTGRAAEDPVNDAESDSDEDEESESRNEAMEEIEFIWRSIKWVLYQWSILPIKMINLFILETARLYEFWIGLPIRKRSWDIVFPTRDDL